MSRRHALRGQFGANRGLKCPFNLAVFFWGGGGLGLLPITVFWAHIRFLKAAKFLPPIADYVVIGDVNAPVKAVVTMDGKIKRSDGNAEEPPEWLGLAAAAGNLHCITTAECTTPPRDASFCKNGVCVHGGGTVFDGAAYLGLGTAYSEMYFFLDLGMLLTVSRSGSSAM